MHNGFQKTWIHKMYLQNLNTEGILFFTLNQDVKGECVSETKSSTEPDRQKLPNACSVEFYSTCITSAKASFTCKEF